MAGATRPHQVRAVQRAGAGRDVGDARATAVLPAAARRAVLAAFGRSQGPTSLQRAPDPAKVAEAATQATRAKADAEALQAIQVLQALPRLPAPFGVGQVLLGLAARNGMPVGLDAAGNPATTAHLIPGKVADVAMVVAGVHGSESSGVEVAERLLAQLATFQPHFTVVVVPQLFPANVATKAAWDEKLAKTQSGIALTEYQKLRDKAGDPGRSSPGVVDPNRQFPELGQDLDLTKPLDAKGRVVEPSNIALMALIDTFKPSRIVSVHAIKDLAQAGIFADPHPSAVKDPKDPQAVAADALALDMAKRADALGVGVKGNKQGAAWTSLYPGQDKTKSAEQMKREGAKGRSLGQWAPSRGITVITVEVGEQHRSGSAVADPGRAAELEAEATVIREIFLGPPATPAAPPATAGQAVPAAPTPQAPAAPVQRLVVRWARGGAGNAAVSRLVERWRP